MDFLKAEIAKKRKASDSPSPSPAPAPPTSKDSKSAQQSSSTSSSSEPATKYVRRGDLERENARREAEQRRLEKEEKERKRLEKIAKEEEKKTRWGKSKGKGKGESTPDGSSPVPEGSAQSSSSPGPSSNFEAFNISPEEAVRRLRAKGQPIRLFAESDRDRRLRLRALELIEGTSQAGRSSGGQNEFMLALKGQESGMALEEIERKRKAETGSVPGMNSTKDGEKKDDKDDQEEVGPPNPNHTSNKIENAKADKGSQGNQTGVGMAQVLDLELIRKDTAKLYPIIYYTLKEVLNEWEKSLAERPDDVRRSAQGKMVAATQVQSAEYLKPLFKSLRQRALPPDVLARISEIVHFMQKREYRHANDRYLQLSIGNAPWPIGVTMVGIHERSGREKIFSSNVAHVLNDEVSRKYIQSLKRLMTFAQTRWPPKDVSMLMG